MFKNRKTLVSIVHYALKMVKYLKKLCLFVIKKNREQKYVYLILIVY